MFSPRRKPSTPVKVHLMVHRRSHSGGIEGERSREEKKEELQEEKTPHPVPAIEKRDPAKKAKKTPVKEALDNAVKLASQAHFAEAIQELDRAVSIHPDLATNVRLHLNRGSYHFKAGLYDEALADFDRASGIDDGVASVHFNRANVLKVMNKDEEALRSFQRASEIDPKLADAHAGVAQMLLKLRKFRQAAASASRALEIDANHFSALDAHIKALAKLGRTAEAIDSVHTLIRWYQRLANVDENCLTAVPTQHRKALARVLDHAAERLPASDAQGLQLAKEAFALDESYESCFELGNQLCARNMHLEASTAFRKCAELDPTKSEAPLLEGASLIQIGDYEKALPPLKRASKLMEDQKEIRFYLGLALLNLGRFSEAVPQLRRVVDSNLDESDEILEKARFLLASAYVHAGEERRAFDLLQIARTSKRAQHDPEVHYQAGYAASLIGLDVEAQACFEDCLRIDPQHSRAIEGLKNLSEKRKVSCSTRPPSPPPLPPPPVHIASPDASSVRTQGPPSTSPPLAPKPPSTVQAPKPPKLPPPSAPLSLNLSKAEKDVQAITPFEVAAKVSPSSYAKVNQLGVVSGAAAVKRTGHLSQSSRVATTKVVFTSKTAEHEPLPSPKQEVPVDVFDQVKREETRTVPTTAFSTDPEANKSISSVATVSLNSSATEHESVQESVLVVPPNAAQERAHVSLVAEKLQEELLNAPLVSKKAVTFAPTAKRFEVATSKVQGVAETRKAKDSLPEEPSASLPGDHAKASNTTSQPTRTAQQIIDEFRNNPVETKPVIKPASRLPFVSSTQIEKEPVKLVEGSDAKPKISTSAPVPTAQDVPSVKSIVSPLDPTKTESVIVKDSASLKKPTDEKPDVLPITSGSANIVVEAAQEPTKKRAPPALPTKRPIPVQPAKSTPPPLPAKRPSNLSEINRVPTAPAVSTASAPVRGTVTLTRYSSINNKLSLEVQEMIKLLFGPPDGSVEVVDHVAQVLMDEGMERIDDFKNLKLEDFERFEGLKRGWCRRLYNYVSDHDIRSQSTTTKAAVVAPAVAALVKTTTSQQPQRNPDLLTGIQGFQVDKLKKTAPARREAQEPTMNELIANIKQFQRGSLRSVELPARATVAPATNDASGFLSTILSAMRSRRVLIEDLDLEGSKQRQQAALSGAEDDDMFEADWI